ncbi:hypothetical protein [Pseudomonas sp.]|uniref:hypothetical protein n=1 Tax=Pseudomonas sp. TaxID=306 RepID=UPI002636254B|nr:hypothetical protein [Pseudomonas sp.]
MPQENESSLSVAEMRLSAYAAPTAEVERQELMAAKQQAERERISRLAGSAELVLALEAQLATEVDHRKRAQVESSHAKKKLEQLLNAVSAAVGRDVRPLGLVHLGLALTESKSKLVTLADYIDKSITLDDLVVLKRVASNLGVIQPQTMAESAQLMGLSIRRAV